MQLSKIERSLIIGKVISILKCRSWLEKSPILSDIVPGIKLSYEIILSAILHILLPHRQGITPQTTLSLVGTGLPAPSIPLPAPPLKVKVPLKASKLMRLVPVRLGLLLVSAKENEFYLVLQGGTWLTLRLPMTQTVSILNRQQQGV